MKRIIFIFSLFMLFFTSCEEEKPVAAITDYDETGLSFHFSNEIASDSKTFTFTASDKWYTAIESVTTKSSNISWLSVSPSSGEAGTHTLTITTTKNTTPDVRHAIVKIVCGNATVTLQVTQEGKEVEVKQIHSIEYKWNGETVYTSYYEYDENIKTTLGTPFIKSIKSENEDTQISKQGNTIKVVKKNKIGNGTTYNYTCYINDKGYVYEVNEYPDYGTYDQHKYSLSYDEDGYLIERKVTDINGEYVYLNQQMSWENGNNSQILQTATLGNYATYHTKTYLSIENPQNLTIDLSNIFTLCTFDFISGWQGKISNNLPETMYQSADNMNIKFSYETDSDNRVCKIVSQYNDNDGLAEFKITYQE